jgi:hypothetical protein
LSEFANKKLFAAWKDSAFFQKVHGGPYRLIRWNDEIELRPDSFYMKLTGETAEQFLAKSAGATPPCLRSAASIPPQSGATTNVR